MTVHNAPYILGHMAKFHSYGSCCNGCSTPGWVETQANPVNFYGWNFHVKTLSYNQYILLRHLQSVIEVFQKHSRGAL